MACAALPSERHLYRRRQSVDQCRRGDGGVLRHRPHAGDGCRSGAGRWAGAQQPQQIEKDNTGYDLKNLFVGAEGNASGGAHHRAAVLQSCCRGRARLETRLCRRGRLPQAALNLLGLATERTAGGG